MVRMTRQKLHHWLAASATLLVLAAVPASAAPYNGTARASAPSGFTVMAGVTTDPNWVKKWNASPQGVPLKASDTLRPGQTAMLVVMFANARPSAKRLRLYCDVAAHHAVDRKDDKVVRNVLCYDGSVPPAGQLTPLGLQINMAANGRSDPPDAIRFDISVTDRRSVRVPLSLTILDRGGGRS
jgi:hypothetical protein